MKPFTTTRWILGTLALTVLVAALPTTARAADFRLVGSFLDTADLSEAPGFGIGVAFPFGESKKWTVDFAAYYFEDFENRFEDVDSPFKVELHSFPIDIGVRYRHDGEDGGFLVGFGVSAFIVDPDDADGDDQEGAFLMVGWRVRNGFTAEVLYRDADIQIENIEVPGFEDIDEFELDMSAFQINVGYTW